MYHRTDLAACLLTLGNVQVCVVLITYLSTAGSSTRTDIGEKFF